MVDNVDEKQNHNEKVGMKSGVTAKWNVLIKRGLRWETFYKPIYRMLLNREILENSNYSLIVIRKTWPCLNISNVIHKKQINFQNIKSWNILKLILNQRKRYQNVKSIKYIPHVGQGFSYKTKQPFHSCGEEPLLFGNPKLSIITLKLMRL